MSDTTKLGGFFWFDLATPDVGAAARFYEEMFGWTIREQRANGGVFNRLSHGGKDIGSVYRLREQAIANGVPAHWTPYVLVADLDDAARRTVACGGEVLVRPFAVNDPSGQLIARIALVRDTVGAQIGLWEASGGDARSDGNR